MAHVIRNRAYEVVLAPAAHRVISGLPDRRGLADALRTELADGPNASREIRFGSTIWADVDPDDDAYTATPLSFDGYTAIHRPMTEDELKRLAEQLGRATASRGFYVIDILPAESAFRRWPRLL